MKNAILLSLVVLSVVGCNPNKESNKRTAGNGGRIASNITGSTNGVFTQSYCGSNMSSVGAIYDQANSFNSNFEARVKGLLSATIDPNEVGQISSSPNDQTGVRFQGSIRIEQNGSVNLDQTKISIKVYDSYVVQSAMDGSNQYQPIPIEFSSATSGQFNMQTGSGYVVFRDQYGEVRLDGNLSGDYFSGQVSFANASNVTGGAAAQGVLGQFYIARCAIIK